MTDYQNIAKNWEEIESWLHDLGLSDQAVARIKVVFDAEVEKLQEDDYLAAQEQRAR